MKNTVLWDWKCTYREFSQINIIDVDDFYKRIKNANTYSY